MKKGIYIDRIVEDPRERDPDFGRGAASEGVFLLRRYSMNMEIVEEMRKQYGIMLSNSLWVAADMVAASSRKGEPIFDFMITNLPPRNNARERARERGTSLNRKLEGLIGEERARELRKYMSMQDAFTERNYSPSMHSLETVRVHSPETVIIAYTGAPDIIRQRCVREKLVDHLIHRERYGAGLELEWIKDILAGGKGFIDPHEAVVREVRKLMGGAKNDT